MDKINSKTVSPESRKIIKKQVISLLKKDKNIMKLLTYWVFQNLP